MRVERAGKSTRGSCATSELVPSTHIGWLTTTSNSKEFDAFFWPPQAPVLMCCNPLQVPCYCIHFLENLSWFLSCYREEEIPPTILPNKSPWCCSPNTSPHPNSSLIDSCDSDISESNLGTQLKPPPSTRPKPDPGKPKSHILWEGRGTC